MSTPEQRIFAEFDVEHPGPVIEGEPQIVTVHVQFSVEDARKVVTWGEGFAMAALGAWGQRIVEGVQSRLDELDAE